MRLRDRALRDRVALFAGTAVALLCVGFSAVVLITTDRVATQNLVSEIAAVGELTAYYVDRGQVINPLPPISDDMVRPVQVVDPKGRVVAATKELQNKPVMADFAPENPQRVASEVVCHSVLSPDRCHIVVAQRVYRDGDWTIYSAAPTLPFYAYPLVAAILLAGTVVFTGAVAWGARHTVIRSLRPVEAIRAQLDHYRSFDLGRRVPVPKPDDEIRRLAESVNETLNRLEDALERQRRFCSDASHELRTPVTAIRAQLEDALMAPEDVDPLLLCHAVMPSVERLQSIASDLLTLARLDAGTPHERRPVELAGLVADELRGHQDREVVQHLMPGLTVMGDGSHLRQMLAHLLRNAQRHAASTVTVTLRCGEPDRRGDVAEIEVLDDGSGIAADQRETVFGRFTRLDTARSRDAGGVGLGLPIARQIAESHGGTLTIQDSDRGARFVVRLPLASHQSGNGNGSALAVRHHGTGQERR
ncbi:Signal transduction histidine kinase [Nonomuraea maritima]|uniref:histidine kinase n=1 Tax=Nonomuraea maritima TaxID=683260 RepID=A0A1G9BFF2_9ACTN|nr:HAMP domain-containing sensor histidine kinase [Nonomuraea maritima]SDK37595.1 Signal transduction histidine kinase [Nonomuraea maritima]